MQALDYKGAGELVAMLDEAAQGPSVETTVRVIAEGLSGLVADGRLQLPEICHQPSPDHYGRHLLHRSVDPGYTVIAMTWGPGQGTPIHDHSGIWCVECVVVGEIEVVQYDLVERQDDEFRFVRQPAIEAGVGSAGSLIPPYEYHTIRNNLPAATSVTLHVYGGDMTTCSIFEPRGVDGWCRRLEKTLVYDA